MKKTEPIQGFSPIVNDNSELVILGTIPGNVTLKNYLLTGNQDYYFNFSRNHFWQTIGQIFDLNLQLITDKSNTGYQYRKDMLLKYKIALWDIYATCERAIGNASDKAIKNPKANDLKAFLKKYPNIKYVVTNGIKTFKLLQENNPDIVSEFPKIIF